MRREEVQLRRALRGVGGRSGGALPVPAVVQQLRRLGGQLAGLLDRRRRLRQRLRDAQSFLSTHGRHREEIRRKVRYVYFIHIVIRYTQSSYTTIKIATEFMNVGDAAYVMSHAAAEAWTQRLAAGRVDGYRVTGISVQQQTAEHWTDLLCVVRCRYNTVEANSSVFSLIRMRCLLSARTCGQ